MSLELPQYKSDLFTDRGEEISLVEATLARLVAGEQLLSRTIVFRGASGLGKSWLAIHLKRKVLSKSLDTLPLFIGLGPRYTDIIGDPQPETEWVVGPSSEGNAETVRRLAIWISSSVGATIATDAAAHQITSWIVQALEQPRFGPPEPRYRFLVLVLDSVFEAKWDLLEVLETALLASLAALPNVLIVITGRGRAYPWKSPYLNIPLESRELSSFVAAEGHYQFLREQLEGQMPGVLFSDEEIRRIAEIGEGYPKNNLLVAQALTRRIDPSDMVNALLNFIKDPAELAEVRTYLEALCILDGFHEEQIGPLYNTYLGRAEKGWALQRSRDIRNKLVELHVARWDSGRYMIDRSLRSIMSYALREKDRREGTDLVSRLHRRAAELYEEWDEKYKSSYYRDLAAVHRRQIAAGIAPVV